MPIPQNVVSGPADSRHAQQSPRWGWLLVGVWLTASAAQLWSMQVDAVRAGEACSAQARAGASTGSRS